MRPLACDQARILRLLASRHEAPDFPTGAVDTGFSQKSDLLCLPLFPDRKDHCATGVREVRPVVFRRSFSSFPLSKNRKDSGVTALRVVRPANPQKKQGRTAVELEAQILRRGFLEGAEAR